MSNLETLTISYIESVTSSNLYAYKNGSFVMASGYFNLSSLSVTPGTSLFTIENVTLKNTVRVLLVDGSTYDIVPCYVTTDGVVHSNVSDTLSGTYLLIACILPLGS